MIQILKNYNLTDLNTFGIKAQAKFFVEIKSEQDFLELFGTQEFKESQKLFLGGGSNMLFTKDFDGLIILNKLKGIEIIEENQKEVFIKALGGEIWQDLVNFCVDRNLWGIENLSSIYGTVGAAPMQNIGAYGVELKDVLEKVEAINLETGEKKVFSKDECGLGYRTSVFKEKLKDKYFIIGIILKLSKISNPNINYKALVDYLAENKLEIKNSKDVASAISAIRKSKLPDPKILGNAGSFFKNVYIDEKKLAELLKKFPEMPYFREENQIKIPAGWLIEQCDWKGKRVGNVGVHEKQALVLVNYGGATGEEILNLANQIIDSVYKKFDLKLTLEVNLI